MIARLSDGGAQLDDAIPAPAPPRLRVWRRTGAFVVAVEGSSLDASGTTLFYDSRDAKWERFANGRADDPAACRFAAQTAALQRVYPIPADRAPSVQRSDG